MNENASKHTVESAEFSFETMTDERFKYWYGRHEHQLLVRCKQFVKKNPSINKCVDVTFVIDKERSTGKFVATIIDPSQEEVKQQEGTIE